MASRSHLGLLLSVLIMLLALDYSSANFAEGKFGSETGKDVYIQSDDVFLKGRKMLNGLDEKPLYIPGKNKPADLQNSFQEPQTKLDRVDAQNKGEMLKKNETSTHIVVAKHDHDITKNKNDESKTFLEAADEVANLMRKDYKGQDRPKRKPPIHNHEPNN